MKTLFYAVLSAVVVLGLAAQADARGGGGHGGGHAGGHGGAHHEGGQHGGEHHGGEHHGQHQANHNNHHNNNHHAHSHTDRHGNHPFSHDWYSHHPNAWNRGWNNGWGYAGYGALAGWLGASAWDDSPYYTTDNTVYTGDNSNDEESDDADDLEDEQASDPQQVSQATQLATSGNAEPADSAEYLPLGVFSLFPRGDEDPAAYVQLATSKQGVIRGSYYDLATEQAQKVTGAIDKETRKVAFRVQGGKTLFETTVYDLTRPEGKISLHEANGQTRQWALEREEQAPAADEGRPEIQGELINE